MTAREYKILMGVVLLGMLSMVCVGFLVGVCHHCDSGAVPVERRPVTAEILELQLTGKHNNHTRVIFRVHDGPAHTYTLQGRYQLKDLPVKVSLMATKYRRTTGQDPEEWWQYPDLETAVWTAENQQQ